MTNEKFKSEIETLKNFFEIYCNDKHSNQTKHKYNIPYNNKTFNIEMNLCNECNVLYNYSIQKLIACPHDPKPRCRKCPTPCYDKNEWKQMAKIMKYSGMKLGLGKVGTRLKKLLGLN